MQDRVTAISPKTLATHGRTIHVGQFSMSAHCPLSALSDIRQPRQISTWHSGDTEHLPPQFAAIASSAVVGTPFKQARQPDLRYSKAARSRVGG
jgi:hypothetical protein